MIADCRNVSDYPDTDASRGRFAWEFLRRNPDYIADWQRFVEMGQPQSDHVDDPNNPGWSVPIGVLMARPWGLQRLFDPVGRPWYPNGPRWERSTANVSRPGPAADHLTPSGVELTGRIAYTFDMSMPLNPQLENVAESLRVEAEIWRRNHPERADRRGQGRKKNGAFVDMLRILDADAEGTAKADIVFALWPNEENDYFSSYPLFKRFETRRTTALEYRDGKYRELALADVVRPTSQHGQIRPRA